MAGRGNLNGAADGISAHSADVTPRVLMRRRRTDKSAPTTHCIEGAGGGGRREGRRDVGGADVADSAVPMLDVVPLHEAGRPGSRLFEIGEALGRKLRKVLGGAELILPCFPDTRISDSVS